MKTKILLILSSLLISVLNLSWVHAAATSMKTTLTDFSSVQTSSSERQHSGVVSKMANGTIEINAVTYRFVPNQAKVYDLNNQLNRHAEIKAGMFVSFVQSRDKGPITELRLIRQ